MPPLTSIPSSLYEIDEPGNSRGMSQTTGYAGLKLAVERSSKGRRGARATVGVTTVTCKAQCKSPVR